MPPSSSSKTETSYYSSEELGGIGFKALGHHVLISRKTSIYNPSAISIGNHVRIDDFCLLSGGKGITLCNYVHLAAYSALYGGGGILMEDFAGVGPRTCIFSESDDFTGRGLGAPLIPKIFKPGFKSAPVIFRKHSAVGSNCTILPGVEIGEGAGAGAHTLILKNIEPWTIHFSEVHHRIIRRRSSRILELEKQFMQWLEEQDGRKGDDT